MAENRTLARPYARAIFAEAKSKHLLEMGLSLLNTLAQIINDKAVALFMIDPRLSEKGLKSLLIDMLSASMPDALKKTGDSFTNFIRLLVEEKRLNVLPDIAKLYHDLLLAEQHVVEAEVISAFPLSDDHRKSIQSALEKRFNSKVQLKISKDESLIGGALVRAGNWVMDGSVKGKLTKLTESLMG